MARQHQTLRVKGGSYTAIDDKNVVPAFGLEDETAIASPAEPVEIVSTKQLELFNLLKQPVWIFDYIERRFRWSNKAGLELWNAESLEAFYARDMTKMSESTIRKNDQIQAQIEKGGSTSDHWTFFPKGDAKTVHVTCTGIRLDSDGHYCILVHGILHGTETLKSQSLRAVEMLRHLPMAVCQFDMEGQVMFQNTWAELPSGPPTPSLETPATTTTDAALMVNDNEEEKVVCPNDDFTQRFVNPRVAQEALAAISNAPDQLIQLEAELYSTTCYGKTEWSEVQLRKTTDPVTGKHVFLYNAQDKSDAQIARKEREASLQKSEFLAIMAHEIRTPLHQVIGFIDLLNGTEPLTKEQKGFVKLLQSSAEGLMTVINDVLDYSKLEAGEMKIESIPYEPLSVTRGTVAAVQTACREKKLSLKVDWDKNIPYRLLGDPNRLRQILLNLLSNSLKFTKRGGIQVRTCTLDSMDEFVQKHTHQSTISEGTACQSNQKWVKYTVSDTGVGIGEEHQKLVFQKYNQGTLSVARNFGGTGLGLSICQLLVQSMGGEIGVDSQLGKGSSFWFLLPAVPVSRPDADNEAGKVEVDEKREESTGLHILVAEDNGVNQKLIANMLKRLGHTSTIAENGQIAIDMLLQENGSQFDLVLMDVQMPVMDGVEATSRLRTLGFVDLPILGLTASVKQSDYRDLGFDDWLSKPIPLKDLKEKLLCWTRKEGSCQSENAVSKQ